MTRATQRLSVPTRSELPELTSVIADELGHRLLRVEEQLKQVVCLKDKVTELVKVIQYTAVVQQ